MNSDAPMTQSASVTDTFNTLSARIPEIITTWKNALQTGQLPLLGASPDAPKVRRLTDREAGEPADWFFIGDLHGDFYALHACLREIARQCPVQAKILFLGDIVDRGLHPVETLCLLLDWAYRHPGQLLWLAGNHDIAIGREASGKFISTVEPAEFVNELNGPDRQGFSMSELGDLFIGISTTLPRAVLFPDGLLATHGGIPLKDRYDQAKACVQGEQPETFFDWLNQPDNLEDFTWTRIHRNPRQRPNRNTRGAHYGYMDFDDFCALAPALFPVKRLLTGHQHVVGGWHIHERYQIHPAMTLLGLGFDERQATYRDSYLHYREYVFMGRGCRDVLPDVIPIKVDRAELDTFLFPPSVAEAVPPTLPALQKP